MKATIEKIHREFMTAGDLLLCEALKVLNETSENQIEKGERLSRLGFTQTQEAENAKKIKEQLTVSRTVADMVQHYQMYYPNNKFILESQVEAICKKYNLICGPVASYRGFVPNKNLKQIEAFRILDEDAVGDYAILSHGGKYNRTYQYDEILKVYPNKKIPLEFIDADGWVGRPGERYFTLGKMYDFEVVKTPSLLICAPKKDMDVKGLSKVGAFWSSVVQVHIPDPVVLKPCKGGYLIVTAWGDEASDPIVVNEKMN